MTPFPLIPLPDPVPVPLPVPLAVAVALAVVQVRRQAVGRRVGRRGQHVRRRRHVRAQPRREPHRRAHRRRAHRRARRQLLYLGRRPAARLWVTWKILIVLVENTANVFYSVTTSAVPPQLCKFVWLQRYSSCGHTIIRIKLNKTNQKQKRNE